MRNRIGSFLAVALVGALSAPAMCQTQVDPTITRPSGKVLLSFVRPGTLAEVLVDEGGMVKEGQLLIRQDCRAEEAQLQALKREAESDVRVRFAKDAMDLARVELERHVYAFLWKVDNGSAVTRSKAKQGMAILAKEGIDGLARLRGDAEGADNFAGPGAVSALEVERAQLELKKALASLEIAELELATNGDNYRQMEVRVEQMRLTSPVNGRVERLAKRKGESCDALENVIYVIQTDPLWVEKSVPIDQASLLEVGQTAQVQFPAQTAGVSAARGPTTVGGKVIFKSAQAGQDGKLMIRVEVPNPASRPAGELVHVRFDGLRQVEAAAPTTRPVVTPAAARPAAPAPRS